MRTVDIGIAVAIVGLAVVSLVRTDAGPGDATPPEFTRIHPLTIDLGQRVGLGEPDARLVLIEFGDYQCPFCRQFARSVLPDFIARYVRTGQVRYFFLNAPSRAHSLAMPAAIAVACAGQAGEYWNAHDYLFGLGVFDSETQLDPVRHIDTSSGEQQTACSAGREAVAEDIALMTTLAVSATPTFFVGRAGEKLATTVDQRVSGSPSLGSIGAALAKEMEIE